MHSIPAPLSLSIPQSPSLLPLSPTTLSLSFSPLPLLATPPTTTKKRISNKQYTDTSGINVSNNRKRSGRRKIVCDEVRIMSYIERGKKKTYYHDTTYTSGDPDRGNGMVKRGVGYYVPFDAMRTSYLSTQ